MRWFHGMPLVALLSLEQVAGAHPGAPSDVFELRAGAWDRSVALERAGDAASARALLLRAWGETPESYEVTMRLAWLSLQLGDADRAMGWYHRASSLPGASDEAQRGLASATAQRGFARLEDGNRQAARDDFRAALALDPDHGEAHRGLELAGPESHVDPEVWLGLVRHQFPESDWTGGVVFARVPWQVNDNIRLQLAYRYVGLSVDLEGPQPTPSAPGGPGRPPPRAAGNRTKLLHQNELYAGAGYSSPVVAVEMLGLALFQSEQDVAPGAGGMLRLGTHLGMTAEAAAIKRDEGWNGQITPGLYVWPSDSFGLAAGVHITTDHVGWDTSGWAGLTVARDRTEFDVRVHVGTERWPFSVQGTSVLNLGPETTAGGEATLLVPLSRSWQLGIQAQLERLREDETQGSYVGASMGLRWSPARGGTP